MDPDVVEIPPPIHHPSRLVTQKQVILHDVIYIDGDDDSGDEVMIIGENGGKSSKGKTIEAVHHGYSDHEIMPGVEKIGQASGINNYINIFSEDYMGVDEYASLQAHFDHVDIPPGVEARISWLPKYDLGLKKTGKSSVNTTQSNAQSSEMSDSSQPSLSSGPANAEIKGSSPPRTGLSSSQLISHAVPGKKKILRESSKFRGHLGPSKRKKKPANAHASTNHGSVDSSEAMKLPTAGEPPYSAKCRSSNKASGSSSVYHSNVTVPNGSFHTPGIASQNPLWKSSHNFNSSFSNHTSYPIDPLHTPLGHAHDKTWVHNSTREVHNGTLVDSPVATISDEARDEILRKFQSFKQFDTIQDASDHYYIGSSSSMNQHPKNWAKKIQEEWKILQKDLPDSIYVRVYESRMDLLRAMIIGAEGTPYHDGLFFFDISFPSAYPNVPPNVHYHSGGLRLNPNLYNCGKVCLSLLNTWSGNKNEKWLPGVSTILQVLVSIQGLILNAKPYFNEPGFAHWSGSAHGEKSSLDYNEDTFILSLKTMMYLIRKPPKNFEDLVVGHFCTRGHDILVACKAYMEGAQVGCLVKGGVQDVKRGGMSRSQRFKKSLIGYVNMLVKEFAKTGAKDCDKFLSPATIPTQLLSQN